ncbi:hypothetical protein QBZ16_000098 [Prototheca wickerhamii]|uniref:Aminotransferase class I/classII large domain-containing protein n=1 Tax=Prototheca wickerhamii TaxID=3111 RepID=A0AAD9IMP4_PROWI|nr:hypothetical protein QBZ16_000098 [Prototheca wickerhamii]
MEATDPSPILKVVRQVAANKTKAAASLASEPSVSQYGPVEGMPELRAALQEKLARQNGLEGHEVTITAGANQAFMDVVLSVLSPGDGVVLFVPYYFNHHMALQMTGFAPTLRYGPCDPGTMHPDLDWLAGALAGAAPRIRLVVIVNPSNPSGAVLTREELECASALCRDAGAWLVLDETYEDFVFVDGVSDAGRAASGAGADAAADGTRAPHIIHIFSFSKAYGMAGWRVGYIAHAAGAELQTALLKAQDTIPINAAQLSQRLALVAAREAGPAWVRRRAEALAPARAAVGGALRAALGDDAVFGQGAIYFWARLPAGAPPDEEVMRWLVAAHGVAVVHGSSCGAPGFLRVSFANAPPEQVGEAAARLEAALLDLGSRIRRGAGLDEPAQA